MASKDFLKPEDVKLSVPKYVLGSFALSREREPFVIFCDFCGSITHSLKEGLKPWTLRRYISQSLLLVLFKGTKVAFKE